MLGWGLRIRPWRRALLGLLFLGVGLYSLVETVRSAADWWPYYRAERCADGGGCTGDAEAIVRRTDYVYHRRADEHLVVLSVGGRDLDEVDLADPEEVWESLRTGRRVRARLWEGKVTRVAVDGVGATETNDSPLVAAPSWASWGVAALGLGISMLNEAWLAAEGNGWWRKTEEPADTPGILGLGFAGIAGEVAVVWWDVYNPLAVGAIIVVVAIGAVKLIGD